MQMPEMDGLEATKRIRALEAETVRKSAKYRSVPVICVSAAEERDMAGSPALAHLPCELKQGLRYALAPVLQHRVDGIVNMILHMNFPRTT